MKIALVHDWFTGMRGGEYVIEAIAELFPRSDLYTLLYLPGKVSPVITTLKRHTSLLQKIPFANKRYRHFLPLMPSLIGRFNLEGVDLVISSSHCVAKGIRKPEGAVHVSYVHAPMRYMWNRYDDYFGIGRASRLVRFAAKSVRKRIQDWDRSVSTPERVDLMVANSRYIADQIRDCYGRESRVIHPFVDLSRFSGPRNPGRNYLLVSAFAPYKRIDLAIEAFNRLRLPLIVVGGGQEKERLQQLAGPTIDFLGSLSNAAIADLYSKCRAFIFPGVEDFGITPLEAMAAGAPVIAYGEGGATETVTDKTGVLFRPQSVEALVEAILKIENGEKKFEEADCRARAAEFTKERFQREFLNAVREAWAAAGKDSAILEERIKTGWSSLTRD